MSNKGKYESRNPLKQLLLRRFVRRVRSVMDAGTGTVLDVGTGEGLFWVGSDRPLVGVDVRVKALQEARVGSPVQPVAGSAFELPFHDRSFSLVTLIEVLEHLDEPHRAVEEASRVSSDGALFTVPWEPWFSVLVLTGSFQYPRRLGREPEHVQAFGPRDLERMVSRYFDQVDVSTCFPWIVARATKSEVV